MRKRCRRASGARVLCGTVVAGVEVKCAGKAHELSQILRALSGPFIALHTTGNSCPGLPAIFGAYTRRNNRGVS